MHRKILISALAVLGLLVMASPATAARRPHRYSPRHGVKCRKGYKRVRHGRHVYCVRKSNSRGGRRGARGPQGQTGPQGPEGPAGKNGSLVLVDAYGNTAQLCNDGNCAARSTSTAACPAGYEVFGGGFDTSEGLGIEAAFPESTVLTDRAVPRTEWKVTIKVNPGAMVGPEEAGRAEGSFVAFAVCGKLT